MLLYVNFPSWIRPEVVSFLPVRWYSVMYIFAFITAYIVFRKLCKQGQLGYMDEEKSTSLFMYVIVGLILGARIVSCLIYDKSANYWTHPWLMFWPFNSAGKFIGLPGMSYHGGVIGGCLLGYIFCKKNNYRFTDVADVLMISISLGYTFGRIGNFINGELWGRCTGSSYGMIFPNAPSFSTNIEWVRECADKAGITYNIGDYVNLPRHPSQLYEAFFEGIVLFLILYYIARPQIKKHGRGLSSGMYFLGYGLFRFIIEYFREPDEQMGFIIKLGKEWDPPALFKSLLNISMGQILCFIMICIGLFLIIRSTKLEPTVFSTKKSKKR